MKNEKSTYIKINNLSWIDSKLRKTLNLHTYPIRDLRE